MPSVRHEGIYVNAFNCYEEQSGSNLKCWKLEQGHQGKERSCKSSYLRTFRFVVTFLGTTKKIEMTTNYDRVSLTPLGPKSAVLIGKLLS